MIRCSICSQMQRRLKALTHDPSRRAVLTAVLTAVMTAGKTGRVSGVPSELKIFPKKHCSAMLFRLTGSQDGLCDKPSSRLQKSSTRLDIDMTGRQDGPSRRAVKTGRVSGA